MSTCLSASQPLSAQFGRSIALQSVLKADKGFWISPQLQTYSKTIQYSMKIRIVLHSHMS